MIVKLYRKETGWADAKPNKADKERALAVIDAKCRVKRPSLTDFFSSGAFYTLPAIPSATVKSPGDLILDHADDGYVVEADSLGRQFSPESLRIWIARWLSDFHNDDVAVVVVDEEG